MSRGSDFRRNILRNLWFRVTVPALLRHKRAGIVLPLGRDDNAIRPRRGAEIAPTICQENTRASFSMSCESYAGNGIFAPDLGPGRKNAAPRGLKNMKTLDVWIAALYQWRLCRACNLTCQHPPKEVGLPAKVGWINPYSLVDVKYRARARLSFQFFHAVDQDGE